jgi:hypothetical protein
MGSLPWLVLNLNPTAFTRVAGLGLQMFSLHLAYNHLFTLNFSLYI